MSATSLWGQLKTAAAAGVLFGGYPFARKVYFVGDNAPQFGQQMATIAAAINIMLSGDVLILGPQAHAEGNLSIPATKTNLTFIGAGNRGACFIEPAAAGDEGPSPNALIRSFISISGFSFFLLFLNSILSLLF